MHTRTIAWKTASQVTEEMLQRSTVSAVLCLVRTKNIKHVKNTFLQGFKEKHIRGLPWWSGG